MNGTLIVNDFHLVVRAALDGVGLGFVPPYYVGEHIAQGRLVSLLERWVPQYSGSFCITPDAASCRRPSRH